MDIHTKVIECIRRGHCPVLTGIFDDEPVEIIDGERICLEGEDELWPEEAEILDLIMPLDPPSYLQLWRHPSGDFKVRIDGDERFCFISREDAGRLIGWRKAIQE